MLLELNAATNPPGPEFTRFCACDRHKNPLACTWRCVSREGGFEGYEITKVKAHRANADVDFDSPEDVADFKGNDKADELAKLGSKVHDEDPGAVLSYLRMYKNLKLLSTHAIQVLKDWPTPERGTRMRAIAHESSAMSLGAEHSFVWRKGYWWCTGCFLRTSSVTSSSVPKYCKQSPHLTALLSKPKGHTLYVAYMKPLGFLLYCAKCWAYSEFRGYKLFRPCKGPPLGNTRRSFGHTAKRRIHRREHPVSRQPLYDIKRVA